MKKFILLIVIAIAASCSKNDSALNQSQYVTEIYLAFDNSDTRLLTEVTNSGIKFSWANGEKIYVFQADDPSVDYCVFKYNASSSSFILNEGDGLVVGKEYFATNKQMYYDDCFKIVDGKQEYLTLHDTNSYHSMDDIPLISDIFVAKSVNTIATMHHTVGAVEVPVILDAGHYNEEEKVQYVTLTTNQVGNNPAGTCIITPYAPYFKVRSDYVTNDRFKSVSSCNYIADPVITKSTSACVYIPMMPGTYTDLTITIKFRNSGVSDKELTGSSLTIERGKVTRMPTQIAPYLK